MRIPAVFATALEEGLLAHDVRFEGILPTSAGEPAEFSDAMASLPRSEQREPVVIADLDSLSQRMFREGVVKRMRARGRDIWFMSWIEDADDLFDAFNTTADMVLGPYHAVLSKDDLEDIYAVSDSFVPVVYARRGTAVRRERAPLGILEALDLLEDMGFYRAVVLDTDDSVPGYDWERIADEHPSAVPFTFSPERIEAFGFGSVIAPLRLPRCGL